MPFPVTDIFDEAKKIVGSCGEDTFYRWITDAVALITNKMDPEGLKGFLDICTTGGNCVTLPRQVETVLAVNIGGRPTLGKSQLFSFHLNGPGDCRGSCSWEWSDQGGFYFTYKDLVEPSKLVAYLQRTEDTGSKLIVYGYDDAGNRLRHQVSGQWIDGYPIPTIYGYAIPDSAMPKVGRIEGVVKDKTVGSVRLSTIDDSGATGTLLGVYEPDETLPQYRRIKLQRNCGWVRIAYMRGAPTISAKADRIPLKSRTAFLLALRALKMYNDQSLGEAMQYESNALRMEVEAQDNSECPTFHPIQVVDLNNLMDKTDFNIV